MTISSLDYGGAINASDLSLHIPKLSQAESNEVRLDTLFNAPAAQQLREILEERAGNDWFLTKSRVLLGEIPGLVINETIALSFDGFYAIGESSESRALCPIFVELLERPDCVEQIQKDIDAILSGQRPILVVPNFVNDTDSYE